MAMRPLRREDLDEPCPERDEVSIEVVLPDGPDGSWHVPIRHDGQMYIMAPIKYTPEGPEEMPCAYCEAQGMMPGSFSKRDAEAMAWEKELNNPDSKKQFGLFDETDLNDIPF